MKVLVFGTFDILHEGHLFFLRKAKSFGSDLFVVVALDSTVLKLKKRHPLNNQNFRANKLNELDFVKGAVLGNEGDKFKVVKDLNPDVIVLGYDQFFFTNNLKKELEKKGLNPKIVRLKESYKPKYYKSSILRKK
ncbi:MAG: adenylyltransferase/cytidyltransferase family protein [Candidatus Woesearchaeota archaeon]